MLRNLVVLNGLCACAFVATTATASAPGPDGYFQTGVAVHKAAGKHDYTIVHEMKALPAVRTAQAFAEADTQKRFIIYTLEDVPCTAFSSVLRTGLQREGLVGTEVNRIAQVCPAGVVKARSTIVIAYEPSTAVTSISVEKRGTVTITGRPAMRQVWKVWFGAGAAAAERAGLSSRR